MNLRKKTKREPASRSPRIKKEKEERARLKDEVEEELVVEREQSEAKETPEVAFVSCQEYLRLIEGRSGFYDEDMNVGFADLLNASKEGPIK